jgi:hypothetical protein
MKISERDCSQSDDRTVPRSPVTARSDRCDRDGTMPLPGARRQAIARMFACGLRCHRAAAVLGGPRDSARSGLVLQRIGSYVRCAPRTGGLDWRHRFTTQETVMGKYVIAWLLGVPALLLAVIYFFFH